MKNIITMRGVIIILRQRKVVCGIIEVNQHIVEDHWLVNAKSKSSSRLSSSEESSPRWKRSSNLWKQTFERCLIVCFLFLILGMMDVWKYVYFLVVTFWCIRKWCVGALEEGARKKIQLDVVKGCMAS
jgi:hypothetical protein